MVQRAAELGPLIYEAVTCYIINPESQSDLCDLLAFLVFVQVCDVRALIRAHCFGADEVANSFLLTVDLAERAVHLLLPVDLITVDLNHNKITLGSNVKQEILCLVAQMQK